MSMQRRLFRVVTGLMLTACGTLGWSCGPKKPAATPPPPTPAEAKAIFFAPDAQLRQTDAVPEQQLFTQLLVYRITVPAGSISLSNDFWKHVDEHAVDIPTYEVLYKNGVRVGVAAASEWDYFKEILDKQPAKTQPGAFSGTAARDIDLEMKLKVHYQDLFYVDNSGELVGRSFDRCDNLLRVAFQPAPRKPGTVRLGICPVVRSMREKIVATGDATFNPVPFKWVHPEQFYELNLSADIPLESFLVVAPSPEGKWPSSLGNTFLINDGRTEQTETVMVFRPITYRQRSGETKSVATTQP
ncbi:MAG: hypothetical protein JWN40_4467 [Phycisphaerales bacterium]|nr:hypothetical protein [Phycisphaerales bacterium]